MEVFLQALVNGILLGGFYSLMGMGQNIIFGVMNIVNFCHGEMLMVGMYITYVLYTYFGVDPYVALPIVAVLMFGLGALIQSTLITPSLKTKSFTNLLFLTVGLGLLLTNGALVIFGSTYYKIITPYSQTYIPLGPVTIALPRLVSFLILIVVAIALFAFLKYSTTGKQIRAVSQNPIGAEVVGINVKKIYILTYGLGVALAGIAGSLLTQFYTIYPTVRRILAENWQLRPAPPTYYQRYTITYNGETQRQDSKTARVYTVLREHLGGLLNDAAM